MVKAYARRRIGTVNGIEVHQDLTAQELGWPRDWPFSYIKPGEFNTRGPGVSRYLQDFPPGAGDRFEFLSRTSDGRLGGALIAEVLHEDPTTLRIVWLESVEESAGHGSRLVRALEEWAEGDIDAILLNSRHSAYGFWEKMGYRLHEESVAVILENRDVMATGTPLHDAALDEWLAQVAGEKTIPDELFERHPGALPDTILMEKDLI